jgi:FdhE protein
VADVEMKRILQALEAAGTEDPDLGEYYELHTRLFRVLARARAGISAKLEMVDGAALQARLLEGLPLLSFAQLPLEADRYAELVSTVARVLRESNPDLEGQTVPDSPAECLALARQRFEEGQAVDGQANMELTNTGLDKGEGETSLAQMSADLALKPYLEWAAEKVLPHVEMERWRRKYCPVCGGAPDFAFLGEELGTRYLLCSRCSSQWPYSRVGCPFCGTRDHTKLSYYLSEDELYRLYVCQDCRRYLKVLDQRKVGRRVLFPVERVTTVGMDVAAQQEGYR